MEYYTTGKFAKLANVTERTLRYYDKVGLLKPSFVLENGYRQYTKEDLLQLQKILLLRNLGFSIEEIYPMLTSEQNEKDFVDSLQLQSQLVQKRILYYQNIKDSLTKIIDLIEQKGMNWDRVLELLNLLSIEDQLVEQYKNSNNVNIRIQIHKNYSTNPVHWFDWLLSKIDFSKISRLLEIGCGNGELWTNNTIDLRNREIFLSDASSGMIEDCKKRLGDAYSFMVFNCESIPFKSEFFDCVIANHVLFYLNDMDQGLHEIQRVLRNNGILYCTTYSKNHMKEIRELVHEFDESIVLSEKPLYESFGKENGKEILSHYFSNVERMDYMDELVVDKAKPIVDYILSCHGNQNEKLSNRNNEFYKFIEEKIKTNGAIHITKEACLFVCRK